ncbi:hypothetical protein ETU08_00145 [Apibacter muscae]|uniref:hypothetical protein n=1 Tax=Apibacter muscae TaxID=2509004 RepID=UPI0011ABBC5D|nr:hypothetical protein [Apibacter muscae]TWP31904.1 hypothetical protein ETU08_00145 [Apibacter muscae]
MKDLNKKAKEIYQDNIEKGFHDKKYSIQHMAMLVITELSEAVEAFRKNKWSDVDYYKQIAEKNNEFDSTLFSMYIKDTVEDELADTYIRLLDLAGLKRLELTIDSNTSWKLVSEYEVRMDEKSFIEKIIFIVSAVSSFNDRNISYYIINTLVWIEIICEEMNIDLNFHVQEKLKFNKTRPFKHGKIC